MNQSNLNIPRSVFGVMSNEEYIDWLMKNVLGKFEVSNSRYVVEIRLVENSKAQVVLEGRGIQYFSSKNSEVIDGKLHNSHYSTWVIDLNDKMDTNSCRFCSSKCKADKPCELITPIKGRF